MKTGLIMIIASVLLLASCGEKCISDKEIEKLVKQNESWRDYDQVPVDNLIGTLNEKFPQYKIWEKRGLIVLTWYDLVFRDSVYSCEFTDKGKSYILDRFEYQLGGYYTVVKTGDIEFYRVLKKVCNETGRAANVKWGTILVNPTPFFIIEDNVSEKEATIKAWSTLFMKSKKDKIWQETDNSRMHRASLPDNL